MEELVAADYKLETKIMEKLKIIEFVNEYSNKNKKVTFWLTKLAVNPEFIDKNSKGAYSKGHITQVDKAKIKVCEMKIEIDMELRSEECAEY